MACYYPGCKNQSKTDEHIPPKAFFPRDQRNQLITVRACEYHNTGKSQDDIYVLAHICLNSSPFNRSFQVFRERVVPQLSYNNDTFRKLLINDAIPQSDGSVRYKVDIGRFNKFFTALSFGIIYKASCKSIPINYTPRHIYHNFQDDNESIEQKIIKEESLKFYSNMPSTILNFGQIKALNQTIYSVNIYGISEFKSSITIVHEFYGIFRVTSMITRNIE